MYAICVTDSKLLDKSKKLTVIEGSLQSKERDVPEYIQLDDKNKTAKLVRTPKFKLGLGGNQFGLILLFIISI